MAKANFNLSTFISAIKEDSLARVNRFEVMIPAPTGMSNVNKSYADFTSLYCEMASLPPVNISTKSFKIFGPTYQRPFGAEYGGEGISLTFHVDRDMNVKKFFDECLDRDPKLGDYLLHQTTVIVNEYRNRFARFVSSQDAAGLAELVIDPKYLKDWNRNN